MKTSVPTSSITGFRLMTLLCATALLGISTQAQDDDATAPTASSGMETAFGVKGGVNWSNLWVNDVNDRNARFGGNVGLLARFASSRSLGFQIEALYEQKGTTVTKSFGNIDQEITYKFDYATLPLLVVVPLGEVVELHAGGYLGYMVLSEATSEGDLGYENNDPKDSKFNGFDYGLLGGVGINLGMAQIGARYEHGLADIANNDVSRYVLGSSKNSTVSAYLALILGK